MIQMGSAAPFFCAALPFQIIIEFLLDKIRKLWYNIYCIFITIRHMSGESLQMKGK